MCATPATILRTVPVDHGGAGKEVPRVRQQKLRRLIGPGAAIVFKGSGFYKTDYRSESYKKAAAADKTAGSTAAKTSDGAAKTAEGRHRRQAEMQVETARSPTTTGRKERSNEGPLRPVFFSNPPHAITPLPQSVAIRSTPNGARPCRFAVRVAGRSTSDAGSRRTTACRTSPSSRADPKTRRRMKPKTLSDLLQAGISECGTAQSIHVGWVEVATNLGGTPQTDCPSHITS